MAWTDEARAAAAATRAAKAKHPAKGPGKKLSVRLKSPMTVQTVGGKVSQVIGRRGANLITSGGKKIAVASVAKVQTQHLRTTKSGTSVARSWKSVK